MNPMVPNNELPMLTATAVGETAGLRRLAEETRVAIELLNYQVGRLPSPNLLLDLLPYQEAKESSQVENIVTTNDELYRAVAFGEDKKSAKEVVFYKDALFEGIQILGKRGVLSVGDVESIHAKLQAKTPGVRSNMAEFEGSLTRLKNNAGEVIYTPPHGKPLLQKLLLDLLEYVYDDEMYPAHPLIKIALAHRQFERIHPFLDGNGRTGRILNILFLCQKKYLVQPVLYASGEILRRRAEYYAALAVPEEKHGAERFAEFMLEIFRDTARRTLDIVNRIDELTAQGFTYRFVGSSMDEALLGLFRTAGASAERVNGHVKLTARDAEHLNALVDAARAHGVLVTELTPLRPTLEDVFVDLVKAGETDGAGGTVLAPPAEGRPQ